MMTVSREKFAAEWRYCAVIGLLIGVLAWLSSWYSFSSQGALVLLTFPMIFILPFTSAIWKKASKELVNSLTERHPHNQIEVEFSSLLLMAYRDGAPEIIALARKYRWSQLIGAFFAGYFFVWSCFVISYVFTR